MITMCKVYEFPVKKQLTEEQVTRLYEVAEDYIEVLNDILGTLSNDELNYEDMNELTELVACTYAEGMIKAIEKMEEES